MSRRIIGVTVSTTISPKVIGDKLKPVKTVNGIEPDENGNVDVNAQPKTLVVTVTENADGTLIPNHTQKEIYEYVQSGGIPVAEYNLFRYSHDKSSQSMQIFSRYTTNDKGMLVREQLRIAMGKAVLTQDSDTAFVDYLNEFVDEKLGVIENGAY